MVIFFINYFASFLRTHIYETRLLFIQKNSNLTPKKTYKRKDIMVLTGLNL